MSVCHNIPVFRAVIFVRQFLPLVNQGELRVYQSSQLNDEDAPLTFRIVRLVSSSAEATLEVWP